MENHGKSKRSRRPSNHPLDVQAKPFQPFSSDFMGEHSSSYEYEQDLHGLSSHREHWRVHSNEDSGDNTYRSNKKDYNENRSLLVNDESPLSPKKTRNNTIKAINTDDLLKDDEILKKEKGMDDEVVVKKKKGQQRNWVQINGHKMIESW